MRAEIRDAIKGLVVGVSLGLIVGWVVVSTCCGCGAIVYGNDDADVDASDADPGDETVSPSDETVEDAGSDVGDQEAADEVFEDGAADDDGDDAGEDGGDGKDEADETGGLQLICRNDCSDPGWPVCQDGGPGSEYSDCALGHDCRDCGPRYVYPDGDVAEDVAP